MEKQRFPTPIEVRRQVGRIRLSKRFGRAETSVKLLELLVNSTLDRKPVNEYRIGIEIFGRPQDWVPTLDSIVRTGRHNLRKYLEEFYIDEGRNEPVVIKLPEGNAYRVDYSHNPHSLAQKAYEAGLRKLQQMFRAGGAEIVTVLEHEVCVGRLTPEADFDEVLRYDPEHLEALVGRAESRLMRVLFWQEDPEECLNMAGDDATAALKLDATSWRAQLVIAVICACRGGSEVAAKVCRKFSPQENNEEPAYPNTFWCVMLLLSTGRENDALDFSKMQAAMYPDGTVAQTIYGFVLYMTRRFDEALVQLRQADTANQLRSDRDWFAIFIQGCVLLAQGHPGEALSLFDSCCDKWFVEGFRIQCYANAGNRKKARDIANAMQNGSPALFKPPLHLALANIAIGNTGRRTFHWLEQALLLGDPWMMLFRLWPVFDPLRKRKRHFNLLLEETKRQPWRDLEGMTSD